MVAQDLKPMRIQYAAFDPSLLAKILCYGFVLPQNLPSDYRSIHGLESSFIQGSIFMLGGSRPINTSVWEDQTASSSSVPLIYRDYDLWIETKNNSILCSPLRQSPAILKYFPPYGKVGDYLKFHTETTVFATPVRECVFGAIGRPCQFCTYEMMNPRPLPPDIFVQMFLELVKEKEIRALAIGPGTPNLRDHGIRYIVKLIQALRTHWAGPISVELVPPHDLRDLTRLIDEKIGSLIMSIEIWNDKRREELCPGKSYVSKHHYLEAWKAAIRLLGRGRVSSVLLIGLDEIASIKEGIDAMVELGVVPTLIPFRPYPGIPLSAINPPDPDTYLALARYNVKALAQANIGPKMQVGCTECGGCSLEIEKLS